MSDSPRQSTPACPRCGYDQAGEVARWETMCPLQGKCSECGLDFEWRLVMRPELQVPRWFVETAEPGRTRWTVVPTAIRAIGPWSFWRSVRMEYPVSLWRAAVVCGCIFVVSYTTMMLVMVSAIALNSGRVGPLTLNTFIETLSVPDFWTPFSGGSYEVNWSGAYFNPVTFANRTWSIASIMSCADAVTLLAALLMPLAFQLLPFTLRRCRVRRVHLLRISLYCTPWLLLWSGPFFVIVGESLVRLNWSINLRFPSLDFYNFAGLWASRVPAIVVPVCSLWLLAAWGFACSRYLRLPRAWLVVVSLWAICLMISVLIVLLAWPNGWYDLLAGLI